MPRVRRSRRSTRIRTRAACVTSSAWTSPAQRDAQVRAARRAYYGAVSYVDDQIGMLAGDAAARRAGRKHRRPGARRPWRHAGRARPLVQNELLRARLPDSADRARAGAIRAASRGRIGLAARRAAHARRDWRSGGAPPALCGARSMATACCRRSRAGSGAGEVIGEYLAEGAIAPDRHDPARAATNSCTRPSIPINSTTSPRDPGRAAQSGRAAGARCSLVAEFRAEVARRWNLAALHAAGAGEPAAPPLRLRGAAPGPLPSWDFQPLRDASRLYIRNDQELNDLEGMARFPPVT